MDGIMLILLVIALLGVLAWIAYRNSRRRPEPSTVPDDYREFGVGFRWAVGLPALLSGVMLLLWAWDLGGYRWLLPVLLLLLAGACLLPRRPAFVFRLAFFALATVLVVWGLILVSTWRDAVGMLLGIAFGAVAGGMGGAIGGALSRRMSPMFGMAEMDRAAQLKFLGFGASSGIALGIIAGVVTGGLVGLLGHHQSIFKFLLVALFLAYQISARLVRAAGEGITGLPGALIGGALLGVLAGYLGRLAMAAFMPI